MKRETVTHDTILLERSLPASPARVFAAWTNPEARRQWDTPMEGWDLHELQVDFRVGGGERSRFGPRGGAVFTTEGHYEDIVPDQRFLLAGSMLVDGKRISVSLMTFEVVPEGKGCRLIITEQAAFLDEGDKPENRKKGWTHMLDKLERTLTLTEE